MCATQTGTLQEKEQIKKEHRSLFKIKILIISLMAKYTTRLSYGFQQFSKEMQYNNREKYSLADHLQCVISNPFTPT
jgi:UTP:GlnB (protein PII) uridylyltransferase